MQLPGDTHYEILLVKIVSRVCSLGLFKNHYVNKSCRQNAERLYFTHMGRSPQQSDCYQMWVPLSDVINCAKNIIFNSFWVAGPRKLGIPIDLRSDIHNS